MEGRPLELTCRMEELERKRERSNDKENGKDVKREKKGRRIEREERGHA